jgi:hypothetical protein
VHLDLYTTDQEGEVERLIEIGATRYPREYLPEDDFVVLEDPDGSLPASTFRSVCPRSTSRTIRVARRKEVNPMPDRRAPIEELMRRVQDAGAEIVIEAGNQKWGYAGAFAVPDGHMWKVGRADGFLTR